MGDFSSIGLISEHFVIFWQVEVAKRNWGYFGQLFVWPNSLHFHLKTVSRHGFEDRGPCARTLARRQEGVRADALRIEAR